MCKVLGPFNFIGFSCFGRGCQMAWRKRHHEFISASANISLRRPMSGCRPSILPKSRDDWLPLAMATLHSVRALQLRAALFILGLLAVATLPMCCNSLSASSTGLCCRAPGIRHRIAPNRSFLYQASLPCQAFRILNLIFQTNYTSS